MNSPDRNSPDMEAWERSLDRSLKNWVANSPTPPLTRGRLLDAAESRWSLHRFRLGRYWRDVNAAPSFYRSLDADYVHQAGILQMHSITLSVQLCPGLVSCT